MIDKIRGLVERLSGGGSEPRVPIVFHEDYDITLAGLEKLHPFDAAKYGKVAASLRERLGFEAGDFHEPEEVRGGQLRRVHHDAYLESLGSARTVARVLEMGPLRMLPASALDRALLRPMRLATGGTIRAAHLALEHGWAINLSGGYHHAKRGNGEGFCVYADVPVALTSVWRDHPGLRALVVDLDAHQGNGNSTILGDDERVSILDVYNEDIYPAEPEAAQRVEFARPIEPGTGDEEYLEIVDEALDEALERSKPGLVVYNAGTDIFQGDPLGMLDVGADAIVERDRRVFARARREGAPIVMVLSGGYTPRSAEIIADALVEVVPAMMSD